MEQIQVYASAWSLVGSRFDNGSQHDAAIAEKEALRTMLLAVLQPAVPVGWREALQAAAVTLAAACVDAPEIDPHEAYEAVCTALRADPRPPEV
jgi:hypothetical protein